MSDKCAVTIRLVSLQRLESATETNKTDNQTVLKKILEPLRYFAVAAIVTALILLGFQLGKENNRELVQHLQEEKVRLETELANAREEMKRLIVEQAREPVASSGEETADTGSSEEKAVHLPEPVPAPAATTASPPEASPAEPALGQITETFNAEPAPSDSEEGSAQE